MKKFKFRITTLAVALSLFSVKPLIAEVVDTLNIQEVVVSASRMGSKLKNIPQKIEIITREDLLSLPSENLAEIIKRTSNLDMVQYSGLSAKIGMRGFSPSSHSRSYTLLLINGKPSGTNNLTAIGTNNIERIEIVKGPYSTLYGSDAMGGVINIITRKGGDEPAASIQIETGSFGSLGISASAEGTLTKSVDFNFGFSRKEQKKNYRIGKNNFLKVSESQKIVLDEKSYGDQMDNTTYEMNSLNGRIGAAINPRWHADAEMIYTFAHDIEIRGNYWGTYGQSKKDMDRLNVYLNIERKSGNNHLFFSPYYTNEKDPNYSDNTNAGFINFESKIREYGFKLHDQMAFGNIKATAGTDFGMYDYQSERFSTKGTPTVPYKPNNKNVNMAAFVQLAYSTGKLDANAGLRYDHFSYQIDANELLKAVEAKESYNTVNPSIGIQYRLLENLKFHSSFGTAFSVPDAYQVAGKYEVSIYFPDWDYWWKQAYIGNANLKPERSNTLDMGIKYSAIKQSLNVDLTYFTTSHNDKIVESTLASGEKTYINANQSRMIGLELNSGFDFGFLAKNRFVLELYSNWTFMFKDEVDFEKDGKTITQDMLYVRKTNGNFGLRFDNKKGFSTRLNGRFVGSRLEADYFQNLRPLYKAANYYTDGGYSADDMVIKHNSTVLFDWSWSYQFKNKMSIGTSISNLLDENYSEIDGYNMPGRMVLMNIGYGF